METHRTDPCVIYEDGRLMRSTESDVTFANEMVTSKVIVNSVQYYYDAEGKMTKKIITFANGATRTVRYENNEDNTIVKFSAGGKTVTSHSKNDSFGRKVFDELQLGTGFVSRQFDYHMGQVTDEHRKKQLLKSCPVSRLVSQVVLSDGRTLSYDYDQEGHIIRVVDSVDGITEYTYDELGQLLTETVNNERINTINYDNEQLWGLYGNIFTKNGVAYEYDTVWKDMLVKVGDQTITYDKRGNPTFYLNHTLTWEKGGQLRSFDSNTYTYNANGVRTSKTVCQIKHEYTLEGSKILKETWSGNTLIPLYNNENSVCGVLYNDVPYYFIKNLQGDVIAIVDNDAETVARYSYDAWGVCTVQQDTVGIANINPYRYRGYYYDNEIGMYYLQSRYYDPVIGRFINADEPSCFVWSSFWVDCNMFSYCMNSPVNCIDAYGQARTMLPQYDFAEAQRRMEGIRKRGGDDTYRPSYMP